MKVSLPWERGVCINIASGMPACWDGQVFVCDPERYLQDMDSRAL